MKLTQTKNMHIALGLLIACVLTPSFAYAKKPSRLINDFEDSWFNDFKCAIEIGSGIPFLKEKSYIPLHGGICLGYYFFKYQHTELGEIRSTGRTVSVTTGEGKLALEVGIRMPEQHRYGGYHGFQLTEKFITFPIALRWTIPNFYLGNKWCMVIGVGYIPKYLLSSRYIVTEAANNKLPYPSDIDNLKTELSGLRSFAHDFFLEGGWQFAFGLYTSLALVVHIKQDTGSSDEKVLNSAYVHEQRGSSLDNLFTVTMGLDMISLYKYIHEDDFI